MSKLAELVDYIEFPRMIEMRQKFPRPRVEHISQEVQKQLSLSGIRERIRPGQEIAITGGSRGIDHIAQIIKETADFVKSCGANPFIIPAMGSHGGATAEGQTEVLNALGITEEYCGCPIRATMDTVFLGYTENFHLPVYEDRYANEADGVILINRIKPHPSFSGKIESGICKMAVIGVGKQRGAAFCHSRGMTCMSESLQEIASYLFQNANIIGALGIIENAFDETARLAGMVTEEILEKEPLLLKEAYDNFPQIYFRQYDCLLVEEIGKNISGAGMDAMVISRYTHDGVPQDKRQQTICVLDLTEETHGNACGMGLADVAPKRFAEKVDFLNTYPNNLTSRIFGSCKMPMIVDDDKTAIQAAIHGCMGIDWRKVRLIWIKNTLDIGRIVISEALYEEWSKNRDQYPNMEPVGDWFEMKFDLEGNLERLPEKI